MSKLKIDIKFKPNELGNEGVREDFKKKFIEYFLRRVKFYTPVATGKLKKSWKAKRTSLNRAAVRNTAKYASYIDTGQTLARDHSKGMMYRRALNDAIKWTNRRYGIDLKRRVSIQRIVAFRKNGENTL